MIVEVTKSFEKDISKIADKKLAAKLYKLVILMEECHTIMEIPNTKKLESKGDFCRCRIGNYRLGFKVEEDKITLLRFMHRKDIYKFFP